MKLLLATLVCMSAPMLRGMDDFNKRYPHQPRCVVSGDKLEPALLYRNMDEENVRLSRRKRIIDALRSLGKSKREHLVSGSAK